jgi:HK97 family phage prohead protease
MEHLLLKAATTATTDQGTFEAVISTPTIDREKDIVEPSAMVNALTKWAGLGKLVPLAWAHTDEVVGNVDPSTVRVLNGEVVVKGQVDMSTPRGEETWRLVKSGTLSFSFGFLIPDGGATKRTGGGLQIKEIDVFEISVVPVAPANNDTRVIGWKSHIADRELAEATDELKAELQRQNDFAQSVADVSTPGALKALADTISGQIGKPDAQRKEAERTAREVEASSLPDVPEPEPVEPEPEVDLVKELQEVKTRLADAERSLETLTKKADATGDEDSRRVDPLRKQAEDLALEIASDGQSLRKPPKTVEHKPPEPSLSLKELRQRTRDEMLGLLSGGTIHE